VNSVEINGSFDSLQRPSSYQSWPLTHLRTSLRGQREPVHHRYKKLRDVEMPLANFFASGVLALGAQLGSLLWQLPPNLPFDADRLAGVFGLLPGSTAEASCSRAARRTTRR
jgi:uncharacterized protein YecE (DUF72 family)